MPRKLFDKTVYGSVGAAGRISIQGLADHHDEHGLGSCHIQTGEQSRKSFSYADGQVGRDLALQQAGDGREKSAVARDQGKDGRGVDSGHCCQNPSHIE